MGPIPGIKDTGGRRDVSGHSTCVIQVGRKELQIFAQLYGKPGTPARRACLPAIHDRPLITVLEKLSRAPEHPRDLGDGYQDSPM